MIAASKQASSRIALLTAVVLLSLLTGLRTPSAGASTGTNGTDAPAPAVTIAITSVTPAVLATGATGPVEVQGTVTAVRDVTDLHIRLRYRDRPLGSRQVIADVAAGRSLRVGTTKVIEVGLAPRLVAGASAPFDLTLPAGVTAARDLGVHLIAVQVLGRDGADDAYVQLALLRTFLSTATPDAVPTRVAWLWPLIEAPHRNSRGLFVDDKLADLLSPEGRLGRLLAQAPRVPHATLPNDPMLLQDADTMASGYSVVDPSKPGASVPGKGQAVAVEWLKMLREVSHTMPAVELPYGDPDAVALQRAGHPEQLAAARRLGDDVWRSVLPDAPTPSTTVVWPAREALDAATARTLAGPNVAAIVRRSAVAVTNETPESAGFSNARADVVSQAGLQLVLVDDVVSTSATGDRGAKAANATRAVQRTLAELTQITADAQRPGIAPVAPPTVVIAPPRLWDPAPRYVSALMAALTTANWVVPVSLNDVVAAAADDAVTLRYPASARAAELPQTFVRAVSVWDSATRQFAGALTEPAELMTQTERARLAMQSQSLARLGEQATTLLASATAHTAGEQGKVRVLPGQLTLSSSQTIAVNVHNDLPQDVQVRLGFATHTNRLVMRGTPVHRIPARKTETFYVRAKVLADGKVGVDVALLSPANKPLSPTPGRITVTIRRVGRAASVVIIVAALVLFAAAGLRTTRRLRGPRQLRGPQTGADQPEPGAEVPTVEVTQ